MKRQYRLYSNVAILCAAAAASFWLLLPAAQAAAVDGMRLPATASAPTADNGKTAAKKPPYRSKNV